MAELSPVVTERLERMKADLAREGRCGCVESAFAFELAVQYRNAFFGDDREEPVALLYAFINFVNQVGDAPAVEAEASEGR